MPGKLTTHVLDTANGRPAAGMQIDCFRLGPGGGETLLQTAVTNADGRVDGPLLGGDAFEPGTYRLVFHAGAYFAGSNNPDARRFLDRIPLDFHVDEVDRNYHVPLLVSPWAYSTYRGS